MILRSWTRQGRCFICIYDVNCQTRARDAGFFGFSHHLPRRCLPSLTLPFLFIHSLKDSSLFFFSFFLIYSHEHRRIGRKEKGIHFVFSSSLQKLYSFQFESFTFGKSLPSNFHKNHHGHFRSHSRSTSISSSFSLSSRSTNSFDGSSASIPAPSSKRNSHHKRRSSVSTRGESAEMMGVSLPDLPPSTSEDNINFGDKDSIRRRALLALEGKSDVPYSKVEIPELSTPKLMSDLCKSHPRPT